MRQICVGSPDIPSLSGCQCSEYLRVVIGNAVRAHLMVLRMGPVD